MSGLIRIGNCDLTNCDHAEHFPPSKDALEHGNYCYICPECGFRWYFEVTHRRIPPGTSVEIVKNYPDSMLRDQVRRRDEGGR